MLAATVQSFAHMPLGISDRNSSSKDLSNFVSGEAMASSVSFWLHYYYLQN